MEANDARATSLAAISICESLLLGLVEKGAIDTDDRRQILADAAAAHRQLADRDDPTGLHARVATIIERLAEEADGTMRAFDSDET